MDQFSFYDQSKFEDSSPIQFQLNLILNENFEIFKQLAINPLLPFEELCQQIANQFNLLNPRCLRFFKGNGSEILADDFQFLKNNEKLYVSQGENFNDTKIFAEYQIIKRLGEGGFGKVMLGQHRKTQDLVAIKFLKNHFSNIDDINMVFQEANALKALNHNNIVKILEFYTFKDMKSAFVMEYLEGGELKTFLEKRNWRIEEREAQVLFKQIVSAIYYCHQRHSIIHRDLKLENILFESQNTQVIKIVDFGIAGIFSKQNDTPTNKGSIRYISPEVLIYKTPANPSIDI